jgi:general secretion pathway protein G
MRKAIIVMLSVVLFLLLTAMMPVDWVRALGGRTAAARVQINQFRQAFAQYGSEVGTFPTTQQGLEALRTRPGSVNRWDGPYLRRKIPLDPWGHPYVYKYPGEHGSQPDIVSYGADGQPGGEGQNFDIVSWKN